MFYQMKRLNKWYADPLLTYLKQISHSRGTGGKGQHYHIISLLGFTNTSISNNQFLVMAIDFGAKMQKLKKSGEKVEFLANYSTGLIVCNNKNWDPFLSYFYKRIHPKSIKFALKFHSKNVNFL